MRFCQVRGPAVDSVGRGGVSVSVADYLRLYGVTAFETFLRAVFGAVWLEALFQTMLGAVG